MLSLGFQARGALSDLLWGLTGVCGIARVILLRTGRADCRVLGSCVFRV